MSRKSKSDSAASAHGNRRTHVLTASPDAVESLRAKLAQAQAATEQALRSQSDFIFNMSHELRSPLNSILGFAQLMEADPSPQSAQRRENTDEILKAGWALLERINELIDIASQHSGQEPSQDSLPLDREIHASAEPGVNSDIQGRTPC